MFSRVAVSFYIPAVVHRIPVFPHPHQHVCAEPSSAVSLGALARSSIRSRAARTQTLASPDMSSCLSAIPAFCFSCHTWVCHPRGFSLAASSQRNAPTHSARGPSPSAFRSRRRNTVHHVLSTPSQLLLFDSALCVLALSIIWSSLLFGKSFHPMGIYVA